MGMMTAQEAADLIAPCFEGVKAKKSLHFCNGNLRGRPISHALHCAPWVDVLDRLDGVIDIAAFEVKYFFQWIERESFKKALRRSTCRRCRDGPISTESAGPPVWPRQTNSNSS